MNKSRKTIGTWFWFIGILSFAFAVVCFFYMPSKDMAYGVPLSSAVKYTYGGDAYTGIQNAAAETANNTYHLWYNITNLTNCIKLIAVFVFVILGFLFISLGVFNWSMYRAEFRKNITYHYQYQNPYLH